MKIYTILAIALFIPLTFGNLLAQEEVEEVPTVESTNEEENDDEWDDMWDDFEAEELDESDWGDFSFGSSKEELESNMPTIELFYGISEPQFLDPNFEGSLSAMAISEVRLGQTDTYLWEFSDKIVEFKNQSITLSNASDLFSEYDADADLIPESWRIGLNEEKGYGYRIGEKNSVLFTHGGSILWNFFNMREQSQRAMDDTLSQFAIDKFGDAVRFGGTMESHIKIRFMDNFSVNAGYERVAIFPRHMFWYWFMSESLNGIAHWGLDKFIEEIGERAPMVMPIIYSVFKTALSYGFYELREEQMNWPFDTAEPFMYDNVKFGISFYF